MEVEFTGFEERLEKFLKMNEEELEVPQTSFVIDEFWKPQVNDILKGIFVEKRQFMDSDGDPFYGLLILVKDESEKADKENPYLIYSVTENKFLKSRLKNLKPGDGVKLEYTGKVKVKKGKGKYHTYKIGLKSFDFQESQSNIIEFDVSRFRDKDMDYIASLIRSDGITMTLENFRAKVEELFGMDRMTQVDYDKIMGRLEA